MKDIKLCGIGNGLLDIQYSVNDIDLAKLGLKKGEMRLVTTLEQNEILININAQKVNQASGGSAANTIITFAQFGGKAGYQTSLGNDEFGHYYANEFRELGIELSSNFSDNEPTGTCLVLISPDSERTMNTSLGASALFDENSIDEELIARSEWIYLEGYKLTSQLSSDALLKSISIAKHNNTKIAFTFSDVFVVEIFRDKLTEIVKSSDLIFCNEAEAFAFTNCKDKIEAFESLCSLCPNVAMTLGSKGSLIKFGGEVFEINPFSANPVDSTGAGDTFAGGFLFGMLYDLGIKKAGNLGSLSASIVVSKLGPRLDNDHNSILNQINK